MSVNDGYVGGAYEQQFQGARNGQPRLHDCWPPLRRHVQHQPNALVHFRHTSLDLHWQGWQPQSCSLFLNALSSIQIVPSIKINVRLVSLKSNETNQALLDSIMLLKVPWLTVLLSKKIKQFALTTAMQTYEYFYIFFRQPSCKLLK